MISWFWLIAQLAGAKPSSEQINVNNLASPLYKLSRYLENNIWKGVSEVTCLRYSINVEYFTVDFTHIQNESTLKSKSVKQNLIYVTGYNVEINQANYIVKDIEYQHKSFYHLPLLHYRDLCGYYICFEMLNIDYYHAMQYGDN